VTCSPFRRAHAGAFIASFVLFLALPAAAQTPLTGATAVSVGEYHACAIVAGGVKCWGYDVNGELGAGGDAPGSDGPDAVRPFAGDVVGLPAGSGVTAIAAGQGHTCALAGGDVFCWGRGGEGQLGDGFESLPARTPVPVTVLGPPSQVTVTAIAAATFYTCAIVDGGIACWGDVPGYANDEFVAAPVQVLPPGSGATAIAAGVDHACAVVNGGVQCWGDNLGGQLGNGSTTSSNSPVVAIQAGAGATAVSAGEHESCAVVAGALLCWGLNNAGQLATGVTDGGALAPVAAAAFAGTPVALDAGWGHACAVVDGGVRCWGGGAWGSLGDGGNLADAAFVVAPTPVDVAGLGPGSGATAVGAGMYLSCAVVTGRVFCWGYGAYGALGNGGDTDSSVPVAVVTDDPVANTAPDLDPVTVLPSAVVALGTEIRAFAAFSDPDANDTHVCTTSWGDGAPAAMPASNGACDATHTYAAPGVYLVTLGVSDGAGASDASTYAYVVVFDPSAGFVTGGGWFDSLPGAYAPDPLASGRAHVGFVAKYQPGRSVPSGQTELQFATAGLAFRSTAYEWLVIGGAKATYRGIGTVNGSGDYAFQLTAVDGQLQGGGADRLRMRIWDRSSGSVLYDNQTCGATTADADPCTALGGGAIVIHAAKK
jgi:alpha-tubulin suppressor-like RCC1 family protein